MKIKLLAITVIAAFAFAACGDDGKTPKPTPNPNPGGGEEIEWPVLPGEPSGVAMRSVGYLTSWDYACYLTMDWSALTHINIAFYYIDGDDDYMENPFDNDQTLKNIIAKAHANGVKVLASLRGGVEGFDIKPLMTSEKRAGFISNIMAHLEKFDYDGIDSDLEESNAGFWTNYAPFIQELREKLDEKGMLLTTAVSSWFSDNITDATFACFDFINIMAYDNDSNGFAEHSGYKFAETMAAHYAGRGIAKGKIVIGVPFYGYPKNGGWNDGKSFADILAMYPSAWKSDFAGTYSYNGEQTIAFKSRLATVYGGIMIWHLGQDATGEHSLLGVIKKNLWK